MKTNDKSMLHFGRVQNDVPRHLIVTPDCNLAANTLADNFRRPPYCASCDLRRRLSSYHSIYPNPLKLRLRWRKIMSETCSRTNVAMMRCSVFRDLVGLVAIHSGDTAALKG